MTSPTSPSPVAPMEAPAPAAAPAMRYGKTLAVADLAALPVGAVVLDSGSRAARNERCAWTKTDDTTRLDPEDAERFAVYAWGSIQWKFDYLDPEMVEDFGPLYLIWDGATPPEGQA